MHLNLSKISCLIAEDSAPIKSLLVNVITQLGINYIDAADNGEQAYELFKKKRHDIVLTDWMMEPISGLELTHLIRQDKLSPNKFAPVIMLSGYASFKRVFEARDAGVTEYMVKPFSAHDIAHRISHVINHPRDFVHCKTYFGPDRRRRVDLNYDGEYRRATDNVMNSITDFIEVDSE